MGIISFIIECFQNVLCRRSIKHFMTNVRKTLHMNIIMSQKYYLNWSQRSKTIYFRLFINENIILLV